RQVQFRRSIVRHPRHPRHLLIIRVTLKGRRGGALLSASRGSTRYTSQFSGGGPAAEPPFIAHSAGRTGGNSAPPQRSRAPSTLKRSPSPCRDGLLREASHRPL